MDRSEWREIRRMEGNETEEVEEGDVRERERQYNRQSETQ